MESWKGPAAGTLVTIWNSPEVTRRGILVSLAGEQFVVAAFRSAETTAWTTSLHPFPLRWRRLVPDYQLGCKRLLFSNDWYPAIARDHVDLVTDRVTAVEPSEAPPAVGATTSTPRRSIDADLAPPY